MGCLTETGLARPNIDVTETRIYLLSNRMDNLTATLRADVAQWYNRRCWDLDVILASHRALDGVAEVILRFPIRPNTSVGIDTARLENLHFLTGMTTIDMMGDMTSRENSRADMSIGDMRDMRIAAFDGD